MRTVIGVMLMGALCAVAGEPAKKAAKPARAAAAPRKAARDVIPAGAQRIAENTYSHTDASGKTWYYRRTPFGVMKSELAPAPDAIPAEAPTERVSPFAGVTGSPQERVDIAVVESGDTVTFHRTTPFGPQKWTKQRSDLTADEQALVERARGVAAAAK